MPYSHPYHPTTHPNHIESQPHSYPDKSQTNDPKAKKYSHNSNPSADAHNGDESYEVKVTQKVGVGIIALHNWCTYVNTSLADGTVPTKYPKV